MSSSTNEPNEPIGATGDEIRDAVALGVRDAMRDTDAVDAFWNSAFSALQRRAADRAGKALVGGLIALATRGAVYLLIGLFLYQLGGWAALAKFMKGVVP